MLIFVFILKLYKILRINWSTVKDTQPRSITGAFPLSLNKYIQFYPFLRKKTNAIRSTWHMRQPFKSMYASNLKSLLPNKQEIITQNKQDQQINRIYGLITVAYLSFIFHSSRNNWSTGKYLILPLKKENQLHQINRKNLMVKLKAPYTENFRTFCECHANTIRPWELTWSYGWKLSIRE